MNKTAGYYFREIKETNKEKNNSEFKTITCKVKEVKEQAKRNV